MKTFLTGIIIIFLITFTLITVNIVGKYTIDNENINQDSLNLLSTINDSLEQDYNVQNSLEEAQGINGTNNEDKDSFGFEFLSAKSDAEKKVNILNVIVNGPSLAVATFGIDVGESKAYINLISWFIGILLGIVFFNAVFNRKVSDG